jgi:hypothetical protein
VLLAEVCLSLVLGMLGPLASARRLRQGEEGWYAYSGVLLAAWIVGTSTVLVLRFPDWAVSYLFEAMGRPRWPIVVVGGLVALFAAWLGMRLVVPFLRKGRLRAALFATAGAVCLGALVIALSHQRLAAVVTTFEFRQGVLRPFSQVAGFWGLMALTLISAAIPCGGALVLLALDSRRLPRRTGD